MADFWSKNGRFRTDFGPEVVQMIYIMTFCRLVLWTVKLPIVNFRRSSHTFSSDKICNYVNILCPGDLIYSVFLLIELFKDRLFYALRTVYFPPMTVYFARIVYFQGLFILLFRTVILLCYRIFI